MSLIFNLAKNLAKNYVADRAVVAARNAIIERKEAASDLPPEIDAQIPPMIKPEARRNYALEAGLLSPFQEAKPKYGGTELRAPTSEESLFFDSVRRKQDEAQESTSQPRGLPSASRVSPFDSLPSASRLSSESLSSAEVEMKRRGDKLGLASSKIDEYISDERQRRLEQEKEQEKEQERLRLVDAALVKSFKNMGIVDPDREAATALLDVPRKPLETYLDVASYGVFSAFDHEADKIDMPYISAKAKHVEESFKPFSYGLTGVAYVRGILTSYGKVSRGLEELLGKIPAFTKLTVPLKNPTPKALAQRFVFRAGLVNASEETVEAIVRKSSGQRYDETDFALGMMFGGLFEGVPIGARAYREASNLITKQGIDKVMKSVKKLPKKSKETFMERVGGFMQKFNREPTKEEIFEIAKSVNTTKKSNIIDVFNSQKLFFEPRMPKLKPEGFNGVVPSMKDPTRFAQKGPFEPDLLETREGMEIFEELAAAQKGERIWVDGRPQGKVASMFPEWVPEDLRKKTIFNPVLDKILKEEVPKSKKQLELYTIIVEKLYKRTGKEMPKLSELKQPSVLSDMSTRLKAASLNKKSTKAQIREATGQVRKKSYAQDEYATEYDTRTLRDEYKELEKVTKEENKAELKKLLDVAKENGLYTRFNRIKRQIIKNKKLQDINENDIKGLKNALTNVMSQKEELLEQAVSSIMNPKNEMPILKYVWYRALRAKRQYLNALGPQGEEIAKRIDLVDYNTHVNFTKDLNYIYDSISGLNKKEKASFMRVVEGKVPAISDAQANAAQKWSILAKKTYNKAQLAGLDVGEIKKYYPHMLNDEYAKIVKDEAKQKEVVERLMNSGMSESAANRLWGEIHMSVTVPKKYGSLEKQRLYSDLPDFMLETDPTKVIPKYLFGANERISRAEMFGPKNELINNTIARAAIDGRDAMAIKEVFDSVYKPKTKKGAEKSKLTSAMTGFQTVTKMPLSAITNLSEITLPSLRHGIINAFSGSIKALTKSGKRQAMKYGDISQVLDRAVRDQAGSGEVVSKYLKAVQFTSSQNWANTTKVLSAVSKAEQLAKALRKNPDNLLARRLMDKFGVDPDFVIKNGLTESAKRQIGIRSLEDLMPIRKLDLPLYWSGDLGRLITQFKSYSFKLGDILINEVLAEAKRGNYKPLANYVLVGALSGEVTTDIKDIIKGKGVRELPKGVLEGFSRIGENLLAVGGLGLLTDAVQSIKYGKWSGGYLLSMLGGPTAGDMEKALSYVVEDVVPEIGDHFKRGERFEGEKILEPIGQQVLKIIPVAGPRLQKEFFPYPSQEKNKKNSKVNWVDF